MDNSLKLLEADWDTLLALEKWSDLGRCLRALIKVHKNVGTLSHNGYDLEQKIKLLEKNLNAVDPRTRFAIIGDCLYARRAIRACATDDFGAAFRPAKGERNRSVESRSKA